MRTYTPFEVGQRSRTTLTTAALGLGLITVGLTATAGYIGIAGGVLLALCWSAIPPLYTASGAFVLAAVLVPDGFSGMRGALIGLGVLCVLVAPSLDRDDAFVAGIAAATGLGVLLGTVGSVFLRTTELVPSATALLAAFALGSYAVHRYEIVRIRLVNGGETP